MSHIYVACRMDELNACQPQLLLMSELVANASLVHLFPVNALRNAALLAAKTELVYIGDGERYCSRLQFKSCSVSLYTFSCSCNLAIFCLRGVATLAQSYASYARRTL